MCNDHIHQMIFESKLSVVCITKIHVKNLNVGDQLNIPKHQQLWVVFDDNGSKFTTMQMHQMVWQNRRKEFSGNVGIIAFCFNI
jgi:hypothetical protein